MNSSNSVYAPHDWAKGNSNIFFIVFTSPICITSVLFSFTSIHLHPSILLSAFVHTSLFLVTIHLFLFYLLHFTFTIFDFRSFQILISSLHFYLYIWFYSVLLLVLHMLNHAIYRYYYMDPFSANCGKLMHSGLTISGILMPSRCELMLTTRCHLSDKLMVTFWGMFSDSWWLHIVVMSQSAHSA